jgi:hypothetical protein
MAAQKNNFLHFGIFVRSLRTNSPKPSDRASEAFGQRVRSLRTIWGSLIKEEKQQAGTKKQPVQLKKAFPFQPHRSKQFGKKVITLTAAGTP